MLIVERQQRVLDILRDRKAVELDELARELEVSASTIRRDLESLEKKGVVARTHGGAVYRGPDAESPAAENAKPASGVSPSQAGVVLAVRMKEHIDAKLAIGRWTASQVQPHMTLLLDGGSTVIYAARLITARPIQIVTNSLSIANIFSDDDQVELSLLGGTLYPRTGVTVGPITTGCLADLYADLAIFSVAGIDDDAAFNINLPMSQVEQLMLRQATRSLLLMDSSKFGRKSLVRVCGLGEVDNIVTDRGIGERWVKAMGDRLVIAE
ncbi:MAG: DeoR/GlpR family DNA-binding transcription regulator [Phycisphaeraceae bacterium]